jgi:hypothetical protein
MKRDATGGRKSGRHGQEEEGVVVTESQSDEINTRFQQ